MMAYIVKLESPLIKALHLGELLGFNNLYVKDEGLNPTGSHKDRVSMYHVGRAVEEGYDTITTGTCGNYDVSLAYFARLRGLKPVIFIPRAYSNRRITEMVSKGAQVILVEGSYEDAVLTSSKTAREYGWYDANPGSKNWEEGLSSFKGIAYEIVNYLGKVPDNVIIPVGNGSTLTGVYLGFKELLEKGSIEKLPRIIATTTSHGNPIAVAYRRGSNKVPVLKKVRETWFNEPLVSMIAFDGDAALKAIRESGGFVVEVPDYKMVRYAMLVKLLEGICVLPASASTLEALNYVRDGSREEVNVAVLTGRCI
ncbi:MAG: pyridoxal-phosphate dependent enzyme [Desulfurococcales archaeon]|nr:pyridoxal-phosphate dependent enzyme [Desulfurococcales archaeon]